MEKQFKLVCMAFDGATVKDSIGTLEDCQNRSADMGSKWYFYPFHFIVTTTISEIVIETGSGIIDTRTDEAYQSKLFKGRRLSTVQKIFMKTYKAAEKLGLQLDCIEYDSFMFNLNYKLIR